MSPLLAPARRIPGDAIIVLSAVVAVHAAVQLAEGSSIRLAAVLGFLLVVPGYALTTVVFPATASGDPTESRRPFGPTRAAALDGVERAALSFGLSLALLPLLGLALAALSWPFTPGNILRLTTLLVLALTAIGAVRRLRVAAATQSDRPAGGWVRTGLGLGISPSRVTNLALSLAIIVATGSLAVAVVAPQDGEGYTDVTLLTESDNGELVAAEYPSEFSQGSGQSLVLEVVNHEGQAVEYSVVVKLERVSENRITEADQLHRFERELPAEATWQIRHTVTPSMAGDDLRLVYLVYRGEPPATPHTANAYRYVYLWVDVSG